MRFGRLIYFFLLFSCGLNKNANYIPSDKQIISDKAISRAAVKIKQEKGLTPSGTGGQMMGDIKMLALMFDCYKSINIEDARKLLVGCVSIFMSEINSDEKIQQYLADKPFSSKNIEIEIYLRNPDGSKLAAGNLRVVTANRGILSYKMYDPNTLQRVTVLKESYEEAIQKIRKNDEIGNGACADVPCTQQAS